MNILFACSLNLNWSVVGVLFVAEPNKLLPEACAAGLENIEVALLLLGGKLEDADIAGV